MTDEELLARADAIAENAYAPYSNFHVGAAILTRDGRVLEGVNVENAAYPLGVCAERTVLPARRPRACGRAMSRRSRSQRHRAAAAGSGCTSGVSTGHVPERGRRGRDRTTNELLPESFDL